ncbi:hypothetical protein FGK63_04515 [Ruegeria sediminis]|uniref:Uncharacterized protein n=1 Tax=Ruegeria sediminis TaxID=2583820 RepID=A0ABY2X5T5_9RHOB|nr:hypothetical protein [Ruegeria sediminis]TMV10329.1 hypothetical protein FGK63_04515 [Ruegeria sediminis]
MQYLLPLFLLVAFVGLVPSLHAQTVKTETVTSNTLSRVNYHIGGLGTVSVFLPAEILPGDTLTSRIRIAEEGEEDFDGFKLQIADETHPVRAGLVEWTIPNDADSVFFLGLVGATGNNVARVSVPLADYRSENEGIRGRDGDGLRVLPMDTVSDSYTAIPNDFFDGIEVIAASPRALVIFDTLVLDRRPDPVLCCSEGGPCGLTSCCVFIPSSSCTHCNVSGYDKCLLDDGPPTPNPSPD